MRGSVSSRSLAVLALLVIAAIGARQGSTVWSAHRLGAEVQAQARAGDIRMIGSVTCSYCAAARAWFTEYHVPFTECLIERDTACAAAYKALLAPGTPVMVVRGKRLLGFDPQAVADALSTSPPAPS